MREDAMEFGDPHANVCAPTQQESSIDEHVTAYNAGNIIARSHALTSMKKNVASGRRTMGMFECIMKVYPRIRPQRKFFFLMVFLRLST